ncbi:MAG: insulinase family protein, partial [Saprospiraceae bacterium]|nr:insulinase family protein [Saprospiraceae bacterium]
MIDTRPPLFQVAQINFPTPEIRTFSNGLQVYVIEGGSQEVCKIDFMFLAGRPFEEKKLVAATMASIIKEGSALFSAASIADEVDLLGATLSSPFSFDHISLQLTCLSKHVIRLIPILVDIIRHPTFDEGELSLFKKRTERRLAVDLSNNEVIAYRKATEQYFGSVHPYGYNSDITLYQQIAREDLLLHHQRFFQPHNGILFISGRLPEALLDDLEHKLAGWTDTNPLPTPVLPGKEITHETIIENMGKSQSAIRVGRRLFNRNHEDWPAMFVLNTILGGYFGSRLMKNLREEKGYTYGVQSTLESLKYDGYISISLETERKFVKKALKGIYQEIDILQNDLVPTAEMQMVKNYIGGYR